MTTPWFDHEVSMTEAAETGTALVIQKHADIGIVVTCDGSICDLPRSAYLEPEGRVIRELQQIGKPFVVLLNSAKPEGEAAIQAAESIQQNYGVSVANRAHKAVFSTITVEEENRNETWAGIETPTRRRTITETVYTGGVNG